MAGEGSSALLQRYVDIPLEVFRVKVLFWLLWAL